MTKTAKINWIGVIPARLGSTRLPRKVLSPIRDLPMVEWVWRRASKCKRLSQIWVATDSDEVFSVLAEKQIPVKMTSRDHESGTDRLAEVVQDLGLEEQDWVLNLQGDEPLLNPAHLDHLIASIELDLSGGKKASPESAIPVGMGSSSMNLFSMGTLVTELTEEGFFDPNTVKAILDDQSFALYFTRAQAPYTRKKFEVNRPSLSGGGSSRASGVYKHLGVYAYEVSFLRQFAMWPKHLLEEAEGLEQLRALAHGHKIKCVWVEQPVYEFAGRKGFFSTSVDTQEDLERVRAIVETHQLWP